MGWEERHLANGFIHTQTFAWDFETIATVVTSGDRLRLRNLQINGIYWVDQTTEVNTQTGTMILALMRFPDTVSSPNPDFVNGTGGGVDRQIKIWKPIFTAGQNNPVLFSMRFRAINCSPGQKIQIATRAIRESSTSINHRLEYMYRWWQSDD